MMPAARIPRRRRGCRDNRKTGDFGNAMSTPSEASSPLFHDRLPKKRWRALALGKVAAACAVAFPAAAQPNVDGLWSQVYNWPLIAVHAAMTPEGRVLTYGTKADGTQTGFFIYDLWDPSVGPSGGHT